LPGETIPLPGESVPLPGETIFLQGGRVPFSGSFIYLQFFQKKYGRNQILEEKVNACFLGFRNE
jgi:hypothetical protein